MIKFIKYKFDSWKARKLLRKRFSPDPEFLARARGDFLSRLAGSSGVAAAAKRGFGVVLKYTLTFVIILGLNGGLVAFADGQNVPPTHPLYPFKRLGEDIALTFASPQSKPYLHKQFAERRLEEIKEVSAASSTAASQIVDTLDSDFKTEVNKAFESAEKNDVKIDTLSFCSSFGTMISERGKKGQSVIKEAQWGNFQKYCGGTPKDFKIELE